jgi:hypothetical protein
MRVDVLANSPVRGKVIGHGFIDGLTKRFVHIDALPRQRFGRVKGGSESYGDRLFIRPAKGD